MHSISEINRFTDIILKRLDGLGIKEELKTPLFYLKIYHVKRPFLSPKIDSTCLHMVTD